eukprot:3976451-Pyramimonas_sp.AAC.1
MKDRDQKPVYCVGGIEFVKHFRSHLGPVDGLAVSSDGSYLASVSRDKSAKVYDVINFDMVAMLKLDFVPSDCEWMFKANEAQVDPPAISLLRCSTNRSISGSKRLLKISAPS